MWFPVLYLIVVSLAGASRHDWNDIFYRPFIGSVGRSARQIACVTIISAVLGIPCGVGLRLVRFPLKAGLYFLLFLPLLVPPFLWAIGIESLKPLVSYRWQGYLDGAWAAVLAYTVLITPIVAFTTGVLTRRIPRSACDAALLVGGPSYVIRKTAFFVLPGAAAVAFAGALLTLGDSGVGQITGFHGAPSDILIAFSARGDLHSAAFKAAIISALCSPFIALAGWTLLRRLNFASSGRSSAALRPVVITTKTKRVIVNLIVVFLAGASLMPALIGLLRPLCRPPLAKRELAAAWVLWWDSFSVTAIYFVAAGVGATTLGWILATHATRTPRLQRTLFLLSLGYLTLPPAVYALAVVLLRSKSYITFGFPCDYDWFTGLVLGCHFVPISVAILLPCLRNLPASFEQAAQLHGLSGLRYQRFVRLPLVVSAILVSTVAAGLLALADVSTAMLLQQPGHSSFGAHLFAIMDNSSEQNVASLCVIYGAFPAAIIAIWFGAIGVRNTFGCLLRPNFE
jgi:ABC-type Fe3+ transport system permease subunit